MIVVLVVAALVIMLYASKLSGGAGVQYGPENAPDAPAVSIDGGNIERAERLVGTLPGVQVSTSDLAKLNGFHNWRDKYDREIYYLCDTRYRLVSPVLAKAIMANESSFNANAVRAEPQINDKSIGLMQLLTETARWVAPFRDLSKAQIEEKLYEPITNISIGCKYLTYQIGRYGRDDEGTKKVIAAYNAGSAKYAADGSFVNHGYVANILGRMKVYANDFPPLRTK